MDLSRIIEKEDLDEEKESNGQLSTTAGEFNNTYQSFQTLTLNNSEVQDQKIRKLQRLQRMIALRESMSTDILLMKAHGEDHY